MLEVHPSSIDSFFLCAWRWFQIHRLGRRIAPGIAMIVGSSTHKAAEAGLYAKMRGEPPLKPRQLEECAADHYALAVRSRDGVYVPASQASESRTMLNTGQQHARAFARLYGEHIYPSIEPAAIELHLYWDAAATIRINARVDCIAREPHGLVMRDLKTTGRPKRQDEADQSSQLTAYWYAARENGHPLVGAALDVAVCAGPRAHGAVQRLDTTRGEADLARLQRRLAVMETMVGRGDFPPAAPGWQCDERWCGFRPECPFM